jgi:hypothetical protein
MHGGAAGSGAPVGNQNALKSGRYTREATAQRRANRELLREENKTLSRYERKLARLAVQHSAMRRDRLTNE